LIIEQLSGGMDAPVNLRDNCKVTIHQNRR